LLKIASESLEVKEDTLNHFKLKDPFSLNEVEGYICRKSDYRYGALFIYKVNDWNLIEMEIFNGQKFIKWKLGKN